MVQVICRIPSKNKDFVTVKTLYLRRQNWVYLTQTTYLSNAQCYTIIISKFGFDLIKSSLFFDDLNLSGLKKTPCIKGILACSVGPLKSRLRIGFCANHCANHKGLLLVKILSLGDFPILRSPGGRGSYARSFLYRQSLRGRPTKG